MGLRLEERKIKKGLLAYFEAQYFLQTTEYCKSVCILMSTKVVEISAFFGHYHIYKR